MTDRLILDGEPWKALQIHSLPGECQDFVDLVNEMPQRKNEDLVSYCERIIKACETEHVRYANAFLPAKRRAERNAAEGQRMADRERAEKIRRMRHEEDLQTYRQLAPGVPDRRERIRIAKDLRLSHREFDEIERQKEPATLKSGP